MQWADTMDPKELEARFFTLQDPIDFLEKYLQHDSEEDPGRSMDRVQEILKGLPGREADFVTLYFVYHKTQTDIAAIYRVSQPTVCYRLQRATKRIRFVLQLPPYTEEDLRKIMSSFLSPSDVEIMVYMYQTTCQSAVAKRLGLTQGKVRHRVIRAIRLMEREEHLKPYADAFKLISSHLNYLREIKRASDPHRVEYVID